MTADEPTTPDPCQPGRLPKWLKKPLVQSPQAQQVRGLLRQLGLNTVCSSAHCPNMAECFSRRTATFMILGQNCTRSCRFCAVGHDAPTPPRQDEPAAVAQAACEMGLRHVVVTCVTRDDLPDGGADHFARTIRALRAKLPDAIIEVLTSDFQGRHESIDTVLAAGPDIFNHNLETVGRLSPIVRPQADYRRSLEVLSYAARIGRAPASTDNLPKLYIKSGLMAGLGETPDEMRQAMRDLRQAGCDMLTVGQYLAPSAQHYPAQEFITPEQFERYRQDALTLGFLAVASGPFVRSSYNAQSVFQQRLCPPGDLPAP